MAYATQTDYIEWARWRGMTVPLPEFPFWAERASEEIDLMTSNRLHDEGILAEFKDLVISTTCELAEALYSARDAGNKKLSSMSIGSYSESYVKEDEKSTQKQASNIIRRKLAMTGLLFRG